MEESGVIGMGSVKNEMRYTIIRSARRTLAIQITKDGEVLVRCPNRMSESAVRQFVAQKEEWIRKHLRNHSERMAAERFTPQQLETFATQTKEKLETQLPCWAEKIGVSYQKVTVKKQRTLWGSCSSKKNLNFNCLLALVPQEVFEYIMVHELCHLKEMNHSAQFWAEVERVIPDYRNCRKWLKEQGNYLIERI